MTPLDLLILSLATWRLAYLLAKEKGPYDILTTLRGRFVFLTCIYCVSVWAGAGLYLLLTTPAAPVVWMLAASGGAMLMHRYTGGDHV
jgi:hypothetical protein